MIEEANDPGVVAATVPEAARTSHPKPRATRSAAASRLRFRRTSFGRSDVAIHASDGGLSLVGGVGICFIQ
jgi:hypothetical protein